MLKLIEHIRNIIAEATDGNIYESVAIASTDDPEIWVQITWDMINVSYPFPSPPSDELATLDLAIPDAAALLEWDPEIHATWQHNAKDVEGVASFALAYLDRVYGSSGAPEKLVFERQVL